MQKSISDDSHSFSIENIHGIDNLNDLHLSQLNNQLRYELRNLNTDVDVGMHISGDEEDYEDDVEEVDDVEEANNSNISDTNTSPHDLLDMKHSSKVSNNSPNHSIEHTLQGAFNGSDSEPFKNYIKSIVDRGRREVNNNHSDIPAHDSSGDANAGIHTKVQNRQDEKLDHYEIRSTSTMEQRNKSIAGQKPPFVTRIKDQLKQIPEKGRTVKKIKLGNPKVIHSANNVMIELDPNKSQVDKSSKKSNGDDLIVHIKKCSRCRMKRLQESPDDLEKYQTCMQCRERRKVRDRKPRVLVKLPNLSDDWKTFISKIELNNVIDLHQHNYRAYTDEKGFPRYQPEELTIPIIQSIGEKIVEKYIHPLQDVTGFKFAVRDHHNPSLFDHNRAKKITWMFICSQDKFRRRKSRSENKRQVSNRLKTEECCSKITLSYDLVYGIVQISYNHKHHRPLKVVSGGDYKVNGRLDSSEQNNGNSSIVSSYNAEPVNHPVISNRGEHRRNGDISIKDESKEMKRCSDEEEEEREEGGKKLDADREVVEAAAAAVAAVAAAASRHGVEEEGGVQYDQSKVFDNEQFGNINMQVGDINMMGVGDDVDVDVDVGVGVDVDDVDVDIDVDDVAEIAKLLKQVQQAQSRRLSELKEYEHEEDEDDDRKPSQEGSHGGEDHPQNGSDGLGEVKEGASHYLINQSLLEQVREQVRAHGGIADVDEVDEDDGGDEHDDDDVEDENGSRST
ncbi:hypothetical protein PMKS-003140 [Pichia membranifaciens]|uniref:Uncharacterized protein n=1 Tax=Pichia membranifaciens TaxID=4926 RepID=A0A1Q2YJB9_9ASCO|nr:hypothetical protein PMKS-003140 [Pichia membranifaciens]